MNKTLITLLIFAIIAQSCSSVKVISDRDPSVDFSDFKTYEFYGWANNSDQQLSPFDRERIERAFRDEATKRGITGVKSDGDIIVTLNIIGEVKTQQVANTTTTGVGMSPRMGRGMHRRGMRGPGWGWGTAHSTTVISETQYLEGRLIVEAYDPDEKELIWQAMGTKSVNDDPKKRAADIPKKVAAIMKEYPVPPKK